MSLKELKNIFDEDQTGTIPMHRLESATRNGTLIRELAQKYGYIPYSNKNSRKISHYIHHSLRQ